MTNPADAQRAQAREKYFEISRHELEGADSDQVPSSDFLWWCYQKFRHEVPADDNLILLWRKDFDALTTERDTLREALEGLLNQIAAWHKVSIGSINSHYSGRVSVEYLASARAALKEPR